MTIQKLPWNKKGTNIAVVVFSLSLFKNFYFENMALTNRRFLCLIFQSQHGDQHGKPMHIAY